MYFVGVPVCPLVVGQGLTDPAPPEQARPTLHSQLAGHCGPRFTVKVGYILAGRFNDSTAEKPQDPQNGPKNRKLKCCHR